VKKKGKNPTPNMDRLIDELTSLDFSHEIFQNNERALEFLTRHGVLQSSLVYDKCGSATRLQNERKALDGKIFRCINTSCRRRMSIRKGSKLEKIRIDANKVLKGIYF
jgi:hypothetical protein